jgi:hypothetical protein
LGKYFFKGFNGDFGINAGIELRGGVSPLACGRQIIEFSNNQAAGKAGCAGIFGIMGRVGTGQYEFSGILKILKPGNMGGPCGHSSVQAIRYIFTDNRV